MPAQTVKPAGLTGEQLRAAAAVEPGVFIEAAPGSGKTTVAAERFGYLRYRDPGEPRATVALSFTRAATAELRRPIVRTWGVDPLRGPHRVVTIDTFLQKLLTFLLRAGHLRWPGGHTDLTVRDAWDNTYAHNFARYQPVLALSGRDIVVSSVFSPRPRSHIDNEPFTKEISGGVCTHDDVRTVLTAFASDQLRPILGERLRAVVAHLIVDEVFRNGDRLLTTGAANTGDLATTQEVWSQWRPPEYGRCCQTDGSREAKDLAMSQWSGRVRPVLPARRRTSGARGHCRNGDRPSPAGVACRARAPATRFTSSRNGDRPSPAGAALDELRKCQHGKRRVDRSLFDIAA
ncbi:UvrD-helicase domain-containing protein [Micromonospora sp. NPDC047557]|uniref:UvrD-helicase domain-containing protein n=1 Tax=Micromonospora sp. NPDC047557 TaxID=3364250 RepID=UPI0037194B34